MVKLCKSNPPQLIWTPDPKSLDPHLPPFVCKQTRGLPDLGDYFGGNNKLHQLFYFMFDFYLSFFNNFFKHKNDK